MDVQILYCAPCGYRQRALDLAEELHHRFGAQVDAKEGSLGQFDVFVDGNLVTVGGKTLLQRMLHRPPHSDAVVAAIAQALAPREGDACLLPTKGLNSP